MKTKFLLFALFLLASTSISRAQVAAPTALSATCTGSAQLKIIFTAPTGTITGYNYSTDNGLTYRSAGVIASPITISALSTDGTTPLTANTVYPILIQAVDGTGPGTAGAISASTFSGTGTALDPYLLSNMYHIIEVKNAVNAAAGAGVAAASFKLTANIDMSTAGNWGGIGNSTTNTFKGIFDGNNYSINAIHAGSSATSTRYTYAYVGFFGYIDGATISNLALTNVDYYVSNTAGGSGSSPTIGGLVCATTGTGNVLINNCSVTGNIDALAINTATPGGNTWARAGGILCLPSCTTGSTVKVTIINSSVNATLTAKNDVPGAQGFANCAGILGDVSSKTGLTVEVINCKAAGTVSAISTNYNSYAAGIFASNDAALTVISVVNCMATNAVAATGSNNATVGGIVFKQINAGSQTQFCMALNSSLSATKTTAGAPVYARIGSRTAGVGTFGNNFAAAALLVQTTVAGVGPTAIPITSVDPTASNGADLGVADPTGEATSMLNTYVANNPILYNIPLKTWTNGGLAALNKITLNPVNYTLVNGVLNVKGIVGSKLLCIYSISGKICKQQIATDAYSTSLTKGIYILKVDGFAPTKIAVY